MYLKKNPIVFYNGRNYDYHFIIKELAKEFKKQYTILVINTEKYITFTVPIEKKATRIDKNGEEITKNISYIVQFIYSARFMASSLSNLVNNFSEEIHRIKCKYRHDDKKCDTAEIKYQYCDCRVKKVHRVIKCNQNSWLKPYIDMSKDLRKKARNDFEKDFFKLMNNAVFGKTMENLREHRDMKLVTTERRSNYLMSEPNFHTTKFFRENLLVIEMKKIEIIKSVYLGLSILELSKILMYESWYDYVKAKYDRNASFVIWTQILNKMLNMTLSMMLKQDLTLQIVN